MLKFLLATELLSQWWAEDKFGCFYSYPAEEIDDSRVWHGIPSYKS